MSERNDMPELPEVSDLGDCGATCYGYSADDMYNYAIDYAEQRVHEEQADAARYRAFFDAALTVTFMGETYSSKADCDAAIDAYLKERGK